MVVIRNAFSSNIKIHKKYDLKGSTVDREASQKEREKDEPTYKDNDFLHDKCKIHIGEDAKAKLMDTLGKSRIRPNLVQIKGDKDSKNVTKLPWRELHFHFCAN